MAWGSSKKTTSKSMPVSKSKVKKKKYSLNDRYYYHSEEKQVKSSDYSKGYTQTISLGVPFNVSERSKEFQRGSAAAERAKEKAYSQKF